LSGIDIPQFEERLPSKELQRLHTEGVSCWAQSKSRFRITCLRPLPRKDYRKLLHVLEPVTLGYEEILYEAHAPIRHVYFPLDCFVSC